MTWSEAGIARAVSLQLLQRKCIVMVDNCNWTGHECDILAVTMDLRIIDIEVKISRADLKADAAKDKWWHRMDWCQANAAGLIKPGERWDPWAHKTPRDWPPKVWKHYYALPADIWKPELIDALPSARSGVLLLEQRVSAFTPVVVKCLRRATPNRDAAKIKPESAIDIARLANLRMWEAYKKLANVS